MKYLMVLFFVLISYSFSNENRQLFRHYTCENSSQILEFYFDASSIVFETEDAFVTVKIKDSTSAKGAKYLVRDVKMKSMKNSLGVPCLTSVNYSVMKTNTAILLNYCDDKHFMEETYSGQTISSELKCKLR